MCSRGKFLIDFRAVGAEDFSVSYALGDGFFKDKPFGGILGGDVSVSVAVHKVADGCFALSVEAGGKVKVPCDKCLDEMEQPVASSNRLVAKYLSQAEPQDSEDEDIVTVPDEQATLDLESYIFEFIALSVPIRHVHAPGECNAQMVDLLERNSPARSSDGDRSEDTDPRWAQLKSIKINDKE